MPKKKSLWKRETTCLVCEKKMFNYQYMTKSQSVEYDEWMVAHYHSLGEYEPYPEELKTTICPYCLTASNEYSFGVDNHTYFSRNIRRHEQIKEFFQEHTEDRFKALCHYFEDFQIECAILDKKNNRPANTRTTATFEKIWSNRDQYAEAFFGLMFSEPRDYVTTLVCFGMDRYCQMLRIAFAHDIAPQQWDSNSLKEAIFEKFRGNPLDMKQPEPRFYYITTNYLQSIQYLDKLIEIVDAHAGERHAGRKKDYWRQAYEVMQLCMENDDLSAIPIETKDGGLNLLMAKLHFMYGNGEMGKKCLRFAKNYSDNRLKQISSKNQQHFVNETEELFKEHFESSEEEEAEARK